MRPLLILLLAVLPLLAQKRVPPKRSSQIVDGFGINSDMPREPYLPWNRHWWTSMFDAGVSWIRIGQYENSFRLHELGLDRAEARRLCDSARHWTITSTRWWITASRSRCSCCTAIRCTRRARAHCRMRSTPEPGRFHNPDRSLYSVFWPPKTPDQIAAFVKYVKFVVGHFRGRIQLLRAVERAGHRLLESRAESRRVRAPVEGFRARGARGRSAGQSDLWRPGRSHARVRAARAGRLRLRRGHRRVRLSHLPRLWAEHESGVDGLWRLRSGVTRQAARNGAQLSRHPARHSVLGR